jgi:hypothetical protein
MEIDPFGRDFFRSSHLAKLFRARIGGGEVELIGHRHNSVWDFTVKPALTLQWEAATSVAHDCAIMFVDQPNIKGDLDPLTYRTMKKAFETADDLIPHVRGTTPYAEIALLDAERSMTINTEEHRDQAGAHKLLTELHLPFDFVNENYLTIERLRQFQLLIIPNANYLSKSQREAIKQYVKEGGNLLFSHRTALPGMDSDEAGVVLGNCGKGRFIYWGCRFFKEYLLQAAVKNGCGSEGLWEGWLGIAGTRAWAREGKGMGYA